MRVRLDSIGCRLNTGEMEELARQLAGQGHRVVGPADPADVVVFNTCAVTQVATRKSRKVLRQLRRNQPAARIVATGCYADLSAQETADLGVDLVVANRDKDRLSEILLERGLLEIGDPVGPADATPYGINAELHTRAFVKVQDGCDNRCTFCIVTVARGESRSRPGQRVVEQVNELCAAGYREVVLSGVHLGSYGHDLGVRNGLEELVGRILDETPIERLRLSSLEPWDLRPQFFDLWSDSRLQPHLHLPLQSGSDRILQRMARKTSRAEFAALIEGARERIPGVAISTDMIVGFPGETERDFDESLEFVERMAFSALHVFRYSPRTGTAAAQMSGAVAPDLIKERTARMHELGGRLERAFRSGLVGERFDVLWEASETFGDTSRWSGLTGNYARVVTDTPPDTELRNRIEPALIERVIAGAVYGTTARTVSDPCVQGLIPA